MIRNREEMKKIVLIAMEMNEFLEKYGVCLLSPEVVEI